MNTKNLFLLSGVCVASAVLFSLTTISLHGDVSLLAFPLAIVFSAVSAFFGVQKLFRRGEVRWVPVFRELLQYLPYVLLVAFVLRRAGAFDTPFFVDVVSVFLWGVASALAVFILYYLNPKRVEKYIAGYTVPKKTKKSKLSWALLETLSWIDALVQAVFMVLLLNIFIVQLYEIPSESMVPEFLIKDRVVVFKTLSGPKFPFSDIGLPYLKKYYRGDIVVFRNPHYDNDRKSEVKTFVSQLVYMISFTKVNLNIDEDGRPKADPLVKRLVGIPGEQLVMQDGILYHRTKESDDFTPVEDDATWAEWNLNGVKPSVKSGIVDFPISQSEYDTMIACEQERNQLDIHSVAIESAALAKRFDTLWTRLSSDTEKTLTFELSKNDLLVNVVVMYGGEYRIVPYLLSEQMTSAITTRLLQAQNGADWFSAYMTDWTKDIPTFANNMYDEANYKLNLMIKLTFGRIIVRNLELLANGTQPSFWATDAERTAYFSQAQMLSAYISLLDRRNMPVFPPNDADGNPQYIPEHCYFMMGDNRFNSLDMRHSYAEWLTPVSAYDNYSATYVSNMLPQYVPRSRILGTTAYRFWPVTRRGVPGHTGK